MIQSCCWFPVPGHPRWESCNSSIRSCRWPMSFVDIAVRLCCASAPEFVYVEQYAERSSIIHHRLAQLLSNCKRLIARRSYFRHKQLAQICVAGSRNQNQNLEADRSVQAHASSIRHYVTTPRSGRMAITNQFSITEVHAAEHETPHRKSKKHKKKTPGRLHPSAHIEVLVARAFDRSSKTVGASGLACNRFSGSRQNRCSTSLAPAGVLVIDEGCVADVSFPVSPTPIAFGMVVVVKASAKTATHSCVYCAGKIIAFCCRHAVAWRKPSDLEAR